jgi:hypothetical protein
LQDILLDKKVILTLNASFIFTLLEEKEQEQTVFYSLILPLMKENISFLKLFIQVDSSILWRQTLGLFDQVLHHQTQIQAKEDSWKRTAFLKQLALHYINVETSSSSNCKSRSNDGKSSLRHIDADFFHALKQFLQKKEHILEKSKAIVIEQMRMEYFEALDDEYLSST